MNNSDGIDYSSANSIFVENKNVYIGGCYKVDSSFTDVPCYWKNNDISVKLSDKEGKVSSIFVDNGVVYTTGTCKVDGLYEYRGFYWKNNSNPIQIADNGVSASSIFVYNNKIYVAGNYRIDTSTGFTTNPSYWVINIENNKVEKTVPLLDEKSSPASLADVNSIFVYNGIVYIAGDYRYKEGLYKPCYWIDKDIKPLLSSEDTGCFVNSIYVDKGTVYTVGGKYASKPYYWKSSEGAPNPLTTYDAHAKSVFVFKDKIYIAGEKILSMKDNGPLGITTNNAPYCWIINKEGKVSEISLEKIPEGDKSHYGYVTGIYVTE